MGAEDIKALKELLESEIITQEEYDAKMKQLSAQNSNQESPEEEERAWVDLDALKNLDSNNDPSQLKNSEGNTIIDGTSAEMKTNLTGFSFGDWIKRNLVATVIIALLLGALALVVPQFLTSQDKINKLTAENEKLQSSIESKDSTISSLTSQKNRLEGYEAVVKYFYLDSAVMVIEGGGNIYHRYGCPKLPSQYTYWLYNIDSAIDRGYRQCPTCFGQSIDDFCKAHIEF